MEARQLLQQVARLRREENYQTNAFLLPAQLEELLSKESTVTDVGEHHVALLERDAGFYRLHYYLSRPEDCVPALRAFLRARGELPIVADIVNRPAAAETMAECLQGIGFQPIEILTRMNRKPELTENCPDCPDVEWAVEEDVPEIERLLFQTFNPLVSRLPKQEEILGLTAQKTALVMRDEAGICALVLFKSMSGQQILLDQILVRKNSKQRRLGETMLQTGIARLGSGKRVSLWALSSVVEFYKKYGFEPEERVDYILVFEGERNHG